MLQRQVSVSLLQYLHRGNKFMFFCDYEIILHDNQGAWAFAAIIPKGMHALSSMDKKNK